MLVVMPLLFFHFAAGMLEISKKKEAKIKWSQTSFSLVCFLHFKVIEINGLISRPAESGSWPWSQTGSDAEATPASRGHGQLLELRWWNYWSLLFMSFTHHWPPGTTLCWGHASQPPPGREAEVQQVGGAPVEATLHLQQFFMVHHVQTTLRLLPLSGLSNSL